MFVLLSSSFDGSMRLMTGHGISEIVKALVFRGTRYTVECDICLLRYRHDRDDY